jgi:hypothetical protein
MKDIITVLVLLISTSSLACSCIYSEFSKKDYDQAAYIINGKALKVVLDKNTHERVITFKVSKSFKGKVDEIIEIRTAYSGASCGVKVNNEDKWLLFVYEYNGRKTISLCSKNVRYNRRPTQDKKSYDNSCSKMKLYIKKLKSY